MVGPDAIHACVSCLVIVIQVTGCDAKQDADNEIARDEYKQDKCHLAPLDVSECVHLRDNRGSRDNDEQSNEARTSRTQLHCCAQPCADIPPTCMESSGDARAPNRARDAMPPPTASPAFISRISLLPVGNPDAGRTRRHGGRLRARRSSQDHLDKDRPHAESRVRPTGINMLAADTTESRMQAPSIWTRFDRIDGIFKHDTSAFIRAMRQKCPFHRVFHRIHTPPTRGNPPAWTADSSVLPSTANNR